MLVKNISIKNFRNYSVAKTDFSPNLNVLVGENAVGKTNMLEAIYLAGLGRSPRTSKEKELVKNGEERALVYITIEKKFRSHKIEIQIDNQSKKKVFLDGIPVLRMGELLGVLNVVYFSPDEMKLVKEAPENRRRFLDISLSQQQRVYFFALSKYNKVLKQRNNLLKTSFGKEGLDEMLDIWDVQLAENGAVIIEKRIEYIEKLKKSAEKIHYKMSEGKEMLELEYDTDTLVGKDEEIAACLLKNLKKTREKDKKLLYTTIGPHRDDMKIIINGTDVRKFASQGQQRTTALALKLGEMELFKEETGELPVLILDDVLSELDESRQRLLLESTADAQILLSCTEYNLKNPANVIRIANGTIVK